MRGYFQQSKLYIACLVVLILSVSSSAIALSCPCPHSEAKTTQPHVCHGHPEKSNLDDHHATVEGKKMACEDDEGKKDGDGDDQNGSSDSTTHRACCLTTATAPLATADEMVLEHSGASVERIYGGAILELFSYSFNSLTPKSVFSPPREIDQSSHDLTVLSQTTRLLL